jgi:hypothetical protein
MRPQRSSSDPLVDTPGCGVAPAAEALAAMRRVARHKRRGPQLRRVWAMSSRELTSALAHARGVTALHCLLSPLLRRQRTPCSPSSPLPPLPLPPPSPSPSPSPLASRVAAGAGLRTRAAHAAVARAGGLTPVSLTAALNQLAWLLTAGAKPQPPAPSQGQAQRQVKDSGQPHGAPRPLSTSSGAPDEGAVATHQRSGPRPSSGQVLPASPSLETSGALEMAAEVHAALCSQLEVRRVHMG